LLQGLSSEDIDTLARGCVWRRYTAGQQIISYGAADRDVYFVVSGRVRVPIYSASGREVTFREHGSGDFFGEVAAIDGLKRFGNVVALSNTMTACAPPATFRRLRARPLIAERLLLRLTSLVRQVSTRVIDLSTLAVRNRIHAQLLQFAREAGVDRNTARIEPAPRHADIAGLVGTYREQVTRELSILAREGLLSKQRRGLLIHDVARLKRLVDEVGAV